MGKGKKLSYETGGRFLLGKEPIARKAFEEAARGKKIKLLSDCLLQVLLVQHICYIQVNTEQLIQ